MESDDYPDRDGEMYRQHRFTFYDIPEYRFEALAEGPLD